MDERKCTCCGRYDCQCGMFPRDYSKPDIVPKDIIAKSPEQHSAMADEAEAKEMERLAERDGYEQAVQDIDVLTGGDGEYRCSPNPERHNPNVKTMKRGIVNRFTTLRQQAPDRQLLEQVFKAGWDAKRLASPPTPPRVPVSPSEAWKQFAAARLEAGE